MWSLTLSIFGENIRRVLWTKCVQGTAYTGVQQLFVNCPEVLEAEDKYRTLQAMSRIPVKNKLPESRMLWTTTFLQHPTLRIVIVHFSAKAR